MVKMEYGKVTVSIVRELKRIAGERNVIYEDEDILKDYAADEAVRIPSCLPDVVVKVGSAEEVSQIMKIANRERIPVVPRGAGSSVTGGIIPLYGGIIVSVAERMNKILEIDGVNMVAVAEAGTITNDICKAAEEKGLYYAGYPMSLQLSCIGGNIACNAGGGTFKYGNTGHYVIGVEFVLPTGEIIQTGGKVTKNVGGYNLAQLLVQSEGTLAIITKAILKLLPAHPERTMLVVPFPEIQRALAIVPSLLTRIKELPVLMELADKGAIQSAANYTKEKLPCYDSADAYLFIQIENETQEAIDTLCESIGEQCMSSGAIDVFVANTPTKISNLMKWRIALGEGNVAHQKLIVERASPDLRQTVVEIVRIAGDIVVPVSKLSEYYEALSAITTRLNCGLLMVAHVAEGNMHGIIEPPPEALPEQLRRIHDELATAIQDVVKKLGGAVTGEHGIGLIRKNLLAALKSQEELDLMRRIKLAFDPNWILNPGKIFDNL